LKERLVLAKKMAETQKDKPRNGFDQNKTKNWTGFTGF
jgi:hypothetical protein